jgi:hypothetical protein
MFLFPLHLGNTNILLPTLTFFIIIIHKDMIMNFYNLNDETPL